MKVFWSTGPTKLVYKELSIGDVFSLHRDNALSDKPAYIKCGDMADCKLALNLNTGYLLDFIGDEEVYKLNASLHIE